MTQTSRKYVIMNADDFGFSSGVNRGILAAHEHGIVTSTSVMVRWPASVEVKDVVRRFPKLSLGLHVDLGEWAVVKGGWLRVYAVLTDQQLQVASEVAAEVDRQLDAFRRMTGLEPTHLDSHQHVHRYAPAVNVLTDAAEKLGIPLREVDRRVRYCGSFYGQTGTGETYLKGIGVESLTALFSSLPAGITEFSCHPGTEVDHNSPYGREREIETATLCDPRIRASAVAGGIDFVSFRDVPRLAQMLS